MSTPHALQTLGLAATCLAALGCHPPPRPVAVVHPGDFSIIRSYGWDTEVVNPQPLWSPDDYRLVVRDAGGFEILSGDDGTTPPDVYRSVEGRDSFFPIWLDSDHVLFGPSHNVERLSDGRIVPDVQGLTKVLIGSKPENKQFCALGFRPRLGGHGTIFVQSEDHIVTVDPLGQSQEFGPGFYAQPQAGGDGVAWQETPVFETDWWTGKPVRADLVIHWPKGQVDLLMAGVEPAWCSDGGLVATVLRSDPTPGMSWWKAGTDVVHLAGPGAAPVKICSDAREPACDPRLPIIAVTTTAGEVVLYSEDGTQSKDLGPGSCPVWSFDGTRLAVLDPAGDATRHSNHLTVYVLSTAPTAGTAP